MIPKFPRIKGLRKFPAMEDLHFEFKGGIKGRPIQKVYETILALLNGDGGYIVFGVHDASRTIHGVFATDKEIDQFILQIDRINHSGIIVTSIGQKISTECISVKVMNLDFTWKKLIIIKVVPELLMNYTLSNGKVVQRINASNYCTMGANEVGKTFTEEEVQERIRFAMKELNRKYLTYLRTSHESYKKDIGSRDRRIAQLERQLATKAEPISWYSWLKKIFCSRY